MQRDGKPRSVGNLQPLVASQQLRDAPACALLLGSSSEGIHLHDIVLQYLRKRLSAEEMRAEQTKVVEGMIAASEARVTAMGRGLQDTGSTTKAFAGEEVDW